jgi:hypothetical protein
MSYIIANGTKNIEFVEEIEKYPSADIYYTSSGKSYIRSQFKTLDELCDELNFQSLTRINETK